MLSICVDREFLCPFSGYLVTVNLTESQRVKDERKISIFAVTHLPESRIVGVKLSEFSGYLNVSYPTPLFSLYLSARALRVSVRIRPRSRFC